MWIGSKVVSTVPRPTGSRVRQLKVTLASRCRCPCSVGPELGPEVEVVSSVRLAFPGVERLIIFTHRSTPDSKHARREDELTFNSQPRT